MEHLEKEREYERWPSCNCLGSAKIGKVLRMFGRTGFRRSDKSGSPHHFGCRFSGSYLWNPIWRRRKLQWHHPHQHQHQHQQLHRQRQRQDHSGTPLSAAPQLHPSPPPNLCITQVNAVNVPTNPGGQYLYPDVIVAASGSFSISIAASTATSTAASTATCTAALPFSVSV